MYIKWVLVTWNVKLIYFVFIFRKLEKIHKSKNYDKNTIYYNKIFSINLLLIDRIFIGQCYNRIKRNIKNGWEFYKVKINSYASKYQL
jgi:hypothetical protein